MGHPGSLDVDDVVEIKAADRQGLQELDRGRLVSDLFAQRVVDRLKRPRNKGREAAGLLLELTNDLQVVDAVLDGFAATEHHRRGRAHAELVGGAVDFEPVGGSALESRNLDADFIVEDFGSGSGNGVEAGIAQTRNRVPYGETADVGDLQNLRRR